MCMFTVNASGVYKDGGVWAILRRKGAEIVSALAATASLGHQAGKFVTIEGAAAALEKDTIYNAKAVLVDSFALELKAEADETPVEFATRMAPMVAAKLVREYQGRYFSTSEEAHKLVLVL